MGGIRLPVSFWRRFFALERVLSVKVASFDHYATLEVLDGLVESGAERRIALYTGNDDHILPDLLLPFRLRRVSVLSRTGSGGRTAERAIEGAEEGLNPFWNRSSS